MDSKDIGLESLGGSESLEEDAPVLLELDEAGVEHAMTALSTTILAFKAVGVMLMCPSMTNLK